MKLTVKKQDLNRCVSTVEKAISPKNINQILYGFLILVDEGLTLRATNLEVSIESSVEAKVEEKGRTVVNSKIFSDIARKMPEEEVSIELHGTTMHIQSGKVKFDIVTQAGSDFPTFPPTDGETAMKISSEDLRKGIERAVISTVMDETRPTLSGVLFEMKEGHVNFVALDGYRLSVAGFDAASSVEKNAIVPASSLKELLKILPEETEVSIRLSNSNILFSFAHTFFFSRLIQGNFFDYRSILAKDFAHKVKVKKSAFRDSVERAAILNHDGKAGTLRLIFSPLEMRIEQKSEFGDVVDVIEAEEAPNNLVIGFNSRYLLQGLANFQSEYIYLSLIDAINPCIINDTEDDSHLYLVLPVRLAQ